MGVRGGVASLQAVVAPGLRSLWVCRGFSAWVRMCPGRACDAVSLKQILRVDLGAGE